MCNIWELETIGFPTVDVKHGDGGEGCTKGGEAEDEHRSGVGGVGFVGLAYAHGDDSTSEVLDKKDHRVSCAKAFQGDDLRYAGPKGGRCQRVTDAKHDH